MAAAAVVCLPLVRSVSDNTALAALVTAVSAALFAFLCVTTGSALCFIIPVLSYLCAFAVTGDPISSLTSTAFFPPAFILARMFSAKPKAAKKSSGAAKALAAALSAIGLEDDEASNDVKSQENGAESDIFGILTDDNSVDDNMDAAQTNNIAQRRRPERISAVAAMSASLLICGALYIVFSASLAYGSLSANSLVRFFYAQSDRMRAIISSFTVMSADGTVTPLYTDEAVEYMISYILVCLPSILICAAAVISYLTTCFFSLFARMSGTYSAVIGERWDSSVSIISAVLYALSYIFAAIGSAAQSNTIGAVTTNLIIMLTPAFALMGVKGVWRRMRDKRAAYYSPRPSGGVSALGIVYLMLCAAMLFINPFIPVVLLAFLGAADTIIAYTVPFFTRSEK